MFRVIRFFAQTTVLKLYYGATLQSEYTSKCSFFFFFPPFFSFLMNECVCVFFFFSFKATVIRSSVSSTAASRSYTHLEWHSYTRVYALRYYTVPEDLDVRPL